VRRPRLLSWLFALALAAGLVGAVPVATAQEVTTPTTAPTAPPTTAAPTTAAPTT
jgi:hypothetical protein